MSIHKCNSNYWSHYVFNNHELLKKPYLAQGAVGLFVKELDLIRSRAGLFVREAPGHLERKVGYSSTGGFKIRAVQHLSAI